jgi:Cu2+-exporting ATPase
LGAARFAEIGFLPMRMDALEPLATSTLIVFDKTGTLTQGQPQLVVIESLADLPKSRIRRIAASLEQASEHPFAKAICQAHSGPLEAVEALRSYPSSGVEGTIDRIKWRLGKPEFVAHSESLQGKLWYRTQDLRGRGYSVVMLADEQGPQALFGLSDPPRPGLLSMLVELRDIGLERFVILSGDHPDNVARLAAQLDIKEFHGGFSPREKLDWIKQAQALGQHVIMVGDGINDAPTLAAADVSLSFSEAANVAQASSDFVIISGTLGRLAEACGLARDTRRIILQNLSWAAGYNLSAIPLAALGLIPPWGAAIGMSLSSLLVVGNALRLKKRHYSSLS